MRKKTELQKFSVEDLLGYLNTVTTSTKKGGFQSTKQDNIAALTQSITSMMNVCRPFAALMMLTKGMTDDAKTVTAVKLLEGNAARAIRSWERHVIYQAITNMPPNRVFDMFSLLIGQERVAKEGKSATIWKQKRKSVGGKYSKYLMRRFLTNDAKRLSLWTVKYRNDLKRIVKHLHWSKDEPMFNIIKWLFDGEPVTDLQRKVEEVRAASGDAPPDCLWKLPMEVARGYALNKFKVPPEEFESRFSVKGTKTRTEARQSDKRAVESGGKSTFDPNRAGVFELLTYMSGGGSVPITRDHIEAAASREASGIEWKYNDIVCIVDTSASMYGTRQTPNHPLFKALNLAYVLGQVSKSCKIISTDCRNLLGDDIIPPVDGPTNYARALLEVVETGFDKTVFIMGDGYENAPEGLFGQVYREVKRLDKHNELTVIHLNPVQAAEKKTGVRDIAANVPSVSATNVGSLGQALFLAQASSDPMKALKMYYRMLINHQPEWMKAIMPPEYKELAEWKPQ